MLMPLNSVLKEKFGFFKDGFKDWHEHEYAGCVLSLICTSILAINNHIFYYVCYTRAPWSQFFVAPIDTCICWNCTPFDWHQVQKRQVLKKFHQHIPEILVHKDYIKMRSQQPNQFITDPSWTKYHIPNDELQELDECKVSMTLNLNHQKLTRLSLSWQLLLPNLNSIQALIRYGFLKNWVAIQAEG